VGDIIQEPQAALSRYTRAASSESAGPRRSKCQGQGAAHRLRPKGAAADAVGQEEGAAKKAAAKKPAERKTAKKKSAGKRRKP